jgi:hypothetical protein
VATAIETDSVVADNESQAVAVGRAIVVALADAVTVDVERGDGMDDAEWSELMAYLGRRGIVVRVGVAQYAEVR